MGILHALENRVYLREHCIPKFKKIKPFGELKTPLSFTLGNCEPPHLKLT